MVRTLAGAAKTPLNCLQIRLSARRISKLRYHNIKAMTKGETGMIEVKNLQKIYKSKSKATCKALDNISFTLPDKGMVFICGKSGSGKSTLLNLLAGLDEISGGDIILDGNSFSDFSVNDYDDYRNNYLGFVFQDFCLLDDFTIKENIEISLNLTRGKQGDTVKRVLGDVGLEGFGGRYPKELSGGQKQRVAIARALVKNPQYIFADEPTGNLDSATSVQILELLKKLSRDKLVVIISHSMENAYEYADRIIELADGKIIRDSSKNTEVTRLYDEKSVYIPINKRLSEGELEVINQKILTGKYTVKQDDNSFVKTTQPKSDKSDSLKKSEKVPLKSKLLLSKGFTKHYHLNVFFTSIMASLLIIMFVTAQVFMAFDGSYLIDNYISDTENLVLFKGYYKNDLANVLNKDKLVEVTDEDIATIYDRGYDGEIYKLYSYNLSAVTSGYDSHIICRGSQLTYDDLSNPYVTAGKGVLECDIDYLEKIYGKDGKLDLICGSLEDNEKCSIVITDYFADALCLYRDVDYNAIVNTDRFFMSLSRFRIKAIINTGYKERYSELLSKIEELKNIKDYREYNTYLNEIKSSQLFLNFYNEVSDYLAVGYYIDGDFEQALRRDTSVSEGTWFTNPRFYDIYGNQIPSSTSSYGRELNKSLSDGEIIITTGVLDALNLSYSTDESGALIPFPLVISENTYTASSYDEPYSIKTYTVVGIRSSTQPHIVMSNNDYYDLYSLNVFCYGLYFDNSASIAEVYNPQSSAFFTNNRYVEGIYSITNIIVVFSDIFRLLTIFLAIVCVLLLVSFGQKSIKRRMFDIGVVRALGYKNRDLLTVFVLQITYLLVTVCAVTYISLIYLDNYINQMLIENIILFLNNDLIRDMTLLEFEPSRIIVNLVGISVLTFISSGTLLFTLRKIKPINIIRQGED